MRVAVIGGGVIGLACAYELRKRGVDVVVLDRGEMGMAASWGNAGWVVPSLSGPVPEPGITLTALRWLMKADSPLYIKPRLSPAFIRWLWSFWRHCNRRDHAAGLAAMAHLNRHTMEQYDAWRAEGVEMELHHAGLVMAFLNRDALHRAVEEFAHLQPYGYAPPAPLSSDELRRLAPLLSESVTGGFMIERERHVEPHSLTQGLLRRLEALGTDLRPGTSVSRFRLETPATRDRSSAPQQLYGEERIAAVDTPQGPVDADIFLLAAGAWSSQLAHQAGFRLPVESGKGYSITIKEPRVAAEHPLYLAEAKVGITPFSGSLRVAGTMELSGLSEEIDTRRVDAMRRSTRRFLREWPEGEEEVTWAGMRPLTPDGLPAMGRAPGFSNLFVATGHSMLGITMAPATGAAMAELICQGDSATDLRPFDPGRFS